MCRSVPQMPVRWTRIRTSLMPISGSATSSSHRPGSARLFTSAFTSPILAQTSPTVCGLWLGPAQDPQTIGARAAGRVHGLDHVAVANGRPRADEDGPVAARPQRTLELQAQVGQ